MAEQATGKHAAWGTLSWFSLHFTKGDRRDPASYFSHGVNGYQRFRHEALCEWILRFLPERSVDSIVDVGCGTGALTARLAGCYSPDRIVGIDFLPDAVACAQESHESIEFRVASLPEIDLPDDTFDLVVASEVLYYLSEKEQDEAVGEIRRIIKPGGALLFTSKLGEKYFCEPNAERLIQRHLRIDERMTLHNKTYASLCWPFHCCRRLAEIARGVGDNRRPWWSPLFNSPPGRLLVRWTGAIESRVLTSKKLPEACHRLSRRVAPNLTRSNLTILARKT